MPTSQNGWSANDRSVIATYTIPGSTRKIALRKGDVSVVLLDLLGWIHRNIRKLDTGELDDWGYAERTIRGSSTTLSNHASGSAADVDALLHPLGVKGTWKPAEEAAIRQRLKYYEGVIRWGIDWTRPDEMHFEIAGKAAAVKRIADKIRAGAQTTPTTAVAPAANTGGSELDARQDAMLTALYQFVSGSTTVGEWPGWPTWAGGTEERLTATDYLRRGNVETRQVFLEVRTLRNELAELRKKVDGRT